jgi:hypothetical protein
VGAWRCRLWTASAPEKHAGGLLPSTTVNWAPLHEALQGFPEPGADCGRRIPRNARRDKQYVRYVSAIDECFSLRIIAFFVTLGYDHNY